MPWARNVPVTRRGTKNCGLLGTGVLEETVVGQGGKPRPEFRDMGLSPALNPYTISGKSLGPSIFIGGMQS